MLDTEIKEQLRTVFASLGNTVELVYDHSEHANQRELVGMLEDLAATSVKIVARASGNQSAFPTFWI